MIQIHNNLTAQKEVFLPLQEGKVKMYVCGITPYDECHLGHARCYVFFDTVRRFFAKSGFEVTFVQNFTDIDDKIIARAKNLNRSPKEIADQFIKDYFTQMTLLNIQNATAYPRVTEFIPQIVKFIQKILDKGFAYVTQGNVYYSVRKFARYGKLSKRNLDEMEAGARVELNEQKRDALDFALWKRAKDGEPFWPSPWGNGRPGWHIECSVMAIEQLGETFDIHGGGQDLIFPHHENEIAQSESATGLPFSRYWIHNGFVTVNREKMSKSLGNFFTLREIFTKYSPEVVRFFLLSRHYRTPLDFSDDLLSHAQNSYESLQEVNELCYFLLEENGEESIQPLEDWTQRFLEAMSDDFNTEKAIAVLFQLKNECVEKIGHGNLNWLKRAKKSLNDLCNNVLGVSLQSRLTPQIKNELKIKCTEREEYRKKKDWQNADRIRKEVELSGFLIEDSSFGPLIKSKRRAF